jgi:predicted dithiol-disulfide oxidoreductase (DUF899 family)
MFDGWPLGHKSLSDLFTVANTLFVYHLKYSSGKDRACLRCTSLLDQFKSLKLLVQYKFRFGLTPEGFPEGVPERSFLKDNDAYLLPSDFY